jgi:NTP pyrophosphatase (non-canonical NTP hydrolase)
VSAPAITEALARLDELTRRLRVECPWDREQDERTIVPHTVEEAYELADAANAGDDAKLLDELGDVLFQVHFLALLLEERGAGDLAAVAEHCRQKLIRRHPHVFGAGEPEGRPAGVQAGRGDGVQAGRGDGVQAGPADGVQAGRRDGVQAGPGDGVQAGRRDGVQAGRPENVQGGRPESVWERRSVQEGRPESVQAGRPAGARPHQDAGPGDPRSTLTSGEVLRNWDAIKAGEAGREPGIFGEVPENLPALLYARKLQRRAASAGLLDRAPDPDPARRDADFDEIGERLFALVDEARRLRVDPELALRAAAQRFRDATPPRGDT